MKTTLPSDLMPALSGQVAPPLEWLVLGLALLGFVRYGKRLHAWLVTRCWTRARGRILKADLRKSRRRKKDGSIVYEPVVRYAYEAGGRVLEGRRITAGNATGALAWGLKMLKTFQPGAEVPVYYHPQRPAEAVLIQPASLRDHRVGLTAWGILLAWVLVRLLTA